MIECLYQFAKDFQTLIVGLFGFAGVIYTLRVNAQLALEQHERNVAHETEIMSTALRAELHIIKNSYIDNSAPEENSEETSDAFFPEKTYTDAYHAFVGKIGLLSRDQASSVIKAYNSAEEVPNRLRLLSSGHDASFEKPGYIFVKAEHYLKAIGIYKAMLPAVEEAITKLEKK